MKINSINGISIEDWKKKYSVENHQEIEIDWSKFDESAIELGIRLGLFTINQNINNN